MVSGSKRRENWKQPERSFPKFTARPPTKLIPQLIFLEPERLSGDYTEQLSSVPEPSGERKKIEDTSAKHIKHNEIKSMRAVEKLKTSREGLETENEWERES